MSLMRRRFAGALAALLLLVLAPGWLAAGDGPGLDAHGPPTALEPPREVTRAVAPVPTPWPPVIQVFRDDFDSAKTYATYTGLGGANVYVAGGRLQVEIPADAPRGDGGLRMRLPRGGKAVRCAGFMGLEIPDLGRGSMHWTLIGFDAATGGELPLIEMFLTQSHGSQDKMLSFRYEKNGKGVYAHVKTGKTSADIKEIRWDTRNGGKQVQAEVTFKDGTRASSEWIDPEESTIAGFDVTTDVAEFSADATAGNEVHAEGAAAPDLPLAIERFASDELTALYPHWLVQAHDADAVVVATVAEVGASAGTSLDGSEPVPVTYFLDESLYGEPLGNRFTVLHHRQAGLGGKPFQPGERLLLFLHRDEDGFRDFGRPTGVIPADDQNYRAVASRVAAIHGGAEP